MAGLQKARNGVQYSVRGVMCLFEAIRLFRRRHLRDVNHLALVQTVSMGIRATCSPTFEEGWLSSLLGFMDAPLAAGSFKAFTVRRTDILGRCDGLV
jgi:hypothetical protein